MCSRYEDGECEQFWKHLNENIKPDTKMNKYCKDILLQFDSTKNISITKETARKPLPLGMGMNCGVR